jgi:hypothetical protein
MTGMAQSSPGDGHVLTTVRSNMHKSCTSNARALNIRAGLKVATWNVLTLNQTGYVTALVRTLRLQKISLAGITEARLTGTDSTQVEGATVLHSGGQQHVHGVALVVFPPLVANLTKWSPINDRLLLARFSHRHGHLSVIVAYAPTEDGDSDVKDAFYDQLETAVLSIPTHDIMLILGDLNAVSGTDRPGFEAVVGKFGSGIPNDNSARLLTFCASTGLSIVGSWFRRRDIHRWTWHSNDGHTKKEIDHIITRQRDRGMFKSYRVFRGAEAPASTDHRLIVSSVALQLPFTKHRKPISTRVDVDRLRSDPALSQLYAVEVQNRFCALSVLECDDIETSWGKLSSAITEAAAHIVGTKRNIRQPWMTNDTFEILLSKATARDRGQVQERRRLQGVFNARAKLDKENYLNRLADEAEEGLRHNNPRFAYRAIKRLSGNKGNSAPAPVQKLDGSSCSSVDEILCRWQEHYESALNFPAASHCQQLADLAANTPPSTTVCIDPPTLDEVRSAITSLKNGRAGGLDGIAPELLKYAVDPIASGLQSLFIKVWNSGRVPADWRDGVVVPLYKGKGSKTECSSYRPISLLSVPGKVFGHVLLKRLNPLFKEHRRPEQSGFTAGRSTTDAILALRLLAELHREFQRPLHVAYVDLKSAFDSVDRSALWLALKGIGVPDTLLRLLQDLHTSTGARVRVGCTTSERFSTTSGVRQGCVLAPALFCRAIDWIMEHMQGLGGVTVGAYAFTDLDYADDIALPVSSPNELSSCLSGFSEASKSVGLNVSWPKTKVQCLGAAAPPADVDVAGLQVECVNQFCYLGSILDTSGRCRLDMQRRIGLAASHMNSLARVWSQRKLSLATKLRIYVSCIVSALLYGSETWTLLAADTSRLQAFHMRCQRRILGVKWQDKIRNAIITDRTGLRHISDLISSRRVALFGHVARLGDNTPAHCALKLSIGARTGHPLSPSWKRSRGRPRDTWLKPFLQSYTPIQDRWDDAIKRGHGTLAQRLPPDKR